MKAQSRRSTIAAAQSTISSSCGAVLPPVSNSSSVAAVAAPFVVSLQTPLLDRSIESSVDHVLQLESDDDCSSARWRRTDPPTRSRTIHSRHSMTLDEMHALVDGLHQLVPVHRAHTHQWTTTASNRPSRRTSSSTDAQRARVRKTESVHVRVALVHTLTLFDSWPRRQTLHRHSC